MSQQIYIHSLLRGSELVSKIKRWQVPQPRSPPTTLSHHVIKMVQYGYNLRKTTVGLHWQTSEETTSCQFMEQCSHASHLKMERSQWHPILLQFWFIWFGPRWDLATRILLTCSASRRQSLPMWLATFDFLSTSPRNDGKIACTLFHCQRQDIPTLVCLWTPQQWRHANLATHSRRPSVTLMWRMASMVLRTSCLSLSSSLHSLFPPTITMVQNTTSWFTRRNMAPTSPISWRHQESTTS